MQAMFSEAKICLYAGALARWLAGWLGSWQTLWLTGRLAGVLAGWLAGRLASSCQMLSWGGLAIRLSF